jgi:hypothetical protein
VSDDAPRRRYAFVILLRMKAMLLALPTVVDVPVPEGKHITMCGDVHGQFYVRAPAHGCRVCACLALHSATLAGPSEHL